MTQASDICSLSTILSSKFRDVKLVYRKNFNSLTKLVSTFFYAFPSQLPQSFLVFL